jgi:chemosensory pili system protein ChpA (sensor histidine kinase/response regulator)
MPDGEIAFERFLDEMALLVDALVGRLDVLERESDGDAFLASLHDVVRLATAVTDLAVAFEVTDIATLSEALSQAASSGIDFGAPSPVALLGARDTLSYLQWRLREIRVAGSISMLDQHALSVTQALVAALVSGVPGHDGASSLTVLDDGSLNELSPDVREMIRSFATVELRPRDEEVDERLLGEPARSLGHEFELWTNIYSNMDGGDRLIEMKRIFVSETESDLQDLSELIASYRREPESRGQLPAMTRIAHKIKGSAATIGFPEFAQLAMYFERAIFAFQRSGGVSGDLVALTLGRFLELFDICLASAAALEPPNPVVVEEAQQLYDAAAQSENSTPQTVDAIFAVGVADRVNSTRVTDSRQPAGHETLLQVDSARLDALMVHLSALAVNRGALSASRARVSHAQSDMATAIDRLHEKSAHIVDAYPLASKSLPSVSVPSYVDIDRSEANLRQDVSGLSGQLRDSWRDIAVERYTEVDTALRALTEVVADMETLSATLSSALVQMDQLIEAQEIVLSNIQQDATRMRLAPLADLTPRLEVLASYLASAFGKQLRFTIEGEMTEIDRSLMRALTEPLSQLVRNAIVHGIETPEERLAAGKPQSGKVWIHAYYAGSEVVIEVGDDGRGVNSHALIARAISNGVLDVEKARAISPEAAMHLMFQPGVSTLDRAGAQAGSGIGLDEVATLIRALKGDIVVAESSDQGTVFRIRAPMTLTVLPTLEVALGEHVFTMPFSSVVATFTDVARTLHHTPQDQSNGSLQGVSRNLTTYRLTLPNEMPSLLTDGSHAKVSQLAGTEIQAYSLAECLGVASDEPPSAAVVVERHDWHVALLVNGFGAMRETMVRPLPSYLKRKLIRGVTIRSEDGAMALLIDTGELVDQLLAGAIAPPPPTPILAIRPLPVARVLIVDDSVTIRRTLDQMLTSAGFATALARDGYEALEMMEDELPRVVILDVEMPRLNGYELLGIMRGSPKYAQTRVAMLTSRAGAKHEQHARELGADEYLVKPCPQDTLISAVRRLLMDSESS